MAMGEVMGIIEKVWATCAANHSFAQGKRQQQVLKLFPLALMVMVMVLMMIVVSMVALDQQSYENQ